MNLAGCIPASIMTLVFTPEMLQTLNSDAAAIIASYWRVARLNMMQSSAKRGEAKAKYYLGCAYNDGIYVPRDPLEAVKWWGAAAEEGDSDGQYQLGLAYLTGIGVAVNKVFGEFWLKMAADAGHPMAMYRVSL